MTTIYQPPAQRGYRVFTGMGAADAIAGGGEAAASIVARNVDDQHEGFLAVVACRRPRARGTEAKRLGCFEE